MKVHVLGDSISMHYGPYLEADLQGTMEYSRMEDNGGDSSNVLAYMKARAESGGIDADLLLVNCGLHDIKTDPETGEKQVTIEKYEENLKEIVRTAAAMGVEMVWIRTTPCDEKVHNHEGMGFHRFSADCAAYNEKADEIMKGAGVPSIDLHAFTAGLGPEPFCDHVHFHEHVREKQAEFIADWLREYVKGRESS